MHYFRAWRRRVIVLPTLLAVALFAAGTAWATTPATLTLSTSGTQSFSGQLLMTNFLPPTAVNNGTPCPSQALDPTNSICEHLTLNATASGTATVCVSFPSGDFGMNDLDLYVVDSSGTLVASATDFANPECVTFAVTAGVTYEVRINPSFLEGPIMFTGTVTFTASSTGGGAGGGTPGPGPTGQSFTGGGQDSANQQLTINVFDTDLTKGKVQYLDHNTGCKARVNNFQVVTISPTANGGTAHVVGNDINTGNQVTVDATDNGEPGTSDTFTITVQNQSGMVCQGGGTLTAGNFQYHPTQQ